MIYVDAAVHPWRGKLWCHLFSDDIAALHAFAWKLGLRPGWFQSPPKASWPHYDITASKRVEALRRGAVEADRYTALEIAALHGRPLTPAMRETIDTLRMEEMLS